jgi:cytochrome b6-f complex iron-sulfur subunit
MAKKLSTADILKMARQKAAGGDEAKPADDAPEPAAAEAPATDESTPEAASTDEAAEAPKPQAAPKGPSSILDAIRKQGAPGAEKETPAAAPAPAAGAPKSTADILAMARGKAGGAAKPTAGAKKAAPKKPAAVGATGDLPPVKDMLEQMRRPAAAASSAAGAAVAAPPKAAPVKPAKSQLQIPKKPAVKGKKGTRRSFMKALVTDPLTIAWTLFSVTCGAWLLATARFMFPNVLVEPPTQFKIGAPSDYPPGTVSTKWTAARGIWVVHTDQYKGLDSIYVLASVCTHLGCTPGWLEGEQKFKCPCHGSGFYITGINFEGPAPRPLERVGLKVAPDGSLEVDKSVKFQQEKGQWEDEASYVDASALV